MKSFYGNFAVIVRALAYVESLGAEGIAEASAHAVLNANYLMKRLADQGWTIASGETRCMHEFVVDVGPLKDETGVSAMDVAKRLLDFGIHPPTMYFPLIVHEALMLEPTETDSRDDLDAVAEMFARIWREAHEDPELVKGAPHDCSISRPDDVAAARTPVVRWSRG